MEEDNRKQNAATSSTSGSIKVKIIADEQQNEDKRDDSPEPEVQSKKEEEDPDLTYQSNDLNNTQYLTESDDDFVDYNSGRESPLEALDKKDLQNSDRIPLIPTDFTSISEAMQNFSAVFESRYGAQHAPFYNGPIQKAVTDAFDSPTLQERRPLALYLHHDDAVGAHIFAQNVMCSSEVSSLLKCQFIVWAWDMTQQQNKQTLFEWMNLCGLNLVADGIRSIPSNRYPLLMVLNKDRGHVQRSTIIYGQENSGSALQKLMEGLDHHLLVKEQDKKEERNRIEREQFRKEQAEEYERSLAADRAKQAELNKQKEREKQEEEQRLQEEENTKHRLSVLAQALPKEPAETEPNIITIRYRAPDGKLLERRFRPVESIEMAVIYAETKGYDHEHYRLFTSDRPRKEVSKLDTSKSFAESGWSKREQITIEEM